MEPIEVVMRWLSEAPGAARRVEQLVKARRNGDCVRADWHLEQIRQSFHIWLALQAPEPNEAPLEGK